MPPIKVIDVFAGPGGLNEGFSSLGSGAFSVAASIEMNVRACETLALRAAHRVLAENTDTVHPDYLDLARSAPNRRGRASVRVGPTLASALKRARKHVHDFELASSTRTQSDEIIQAALMGSTDPWVLVGGPPCQLYSLVGRARASKLPGFDSDVRHVLYKEYLHILRTHRPDVFVMENVKGMLSAMHSDGRIFDLILSDIADAGYELRSFVVDKPGDELSPSDFVIRSERYGVPQTRHRVILLGIRTDARRSLNPAVLSEDATVTVSEAIGGLPRVRSRLSPVRADNEAAWTSARAVGLAAAGADPADAPALSTSGGSFVRSAEISESASRYHSFVRRPQMGGFAQHEARSHMAGDISRYAYLSARSTWHGERVKVQDLPADLLPNHKNVSGDVVPFSDRFRVQAANRPASTVVSHISKDGHYFIHPDPCQARSLTVREAARLQSFPDDYLFAGNRTEQFHQVGNAVPPFLARQLAEIVYNYLV